MKISITPETRAFARKVRELSSQELLSCYQCGGCSSGCPIASDMDLLPSTVIRFVQLGQEEVLTSKTIWLCSSCLTCVVRCPQQIDIAKVMEALRQINLRRGVDYVSISDIPDEKRRKLPQIALVANFRKFTA